ncbi:hypothetical protein Zm00014a_043765 [Zea mays]|uniref:Uncharacterized protein n=1 Tax=Zea mays TaxID=4577 RepID=A0A3L6FRE6_MAIZE|nr:hypothetical protein Zm00014a_043765 [Zea mays]
MWEHPALGLLFLITASTVL